MNFPVVFKEKRLKIRRFAAKNVEKSEKQCGKPIFAEFRRFAANGGKRVEKNSPLRGELVFFHQKMV